MKMGYAALAMAALAGCSTPDTAFQLMREQQQIQRAAQDHEAQHRAQSVAADDVVYLSTIRRLQAEGRHFAALAHLDAFQNQFGDTPAVALLRADALRATGQREQSQAGYQALLNGPQAASAWHGLGLLAASQGEFAQAADALGRATALAPTDADMLGDLGYARLRAGDRQGARVPLAQAAELAPDNPKAVANLALLMAADGNAQGAEAVMARAGLAESARTAVRQQAEQLAALPQATRAQPLGTPATAAALVSTAPSTVPSTSPATASAIADASRPVVRAVPMTAAVPALTVPRSSADAVAPTAPAAVSPAATPPAAAPSPALDLYAAPMPSLLDRFAAGSANVQ